MARTTHKQQPMSRSFRVDDKIPQGPDAAVNALPPVVDDTRQVGNVGAKNRWDNDRGMWVPYRGAEDHGVKFDTLNTDFDGPIADGLGGTTQESLVVLPTPSAPDIQPIPVKIVDTTRPSVEKALFRTNQRRILAAEIASGNPIRLIGARPTRTNLTIRVNHAVAAPALYVYIGNKDVNVLTGFAILNAGAQSIDTTEDVWMVGDAALTTDVVVSTLEVFTQVVRPD